MATATILYIRHPRSRRDSSTYHALSRSYCVVEAASGKQALQQIDGLHPDVVVLDAPSLRTTGDRISRRLKQSYPQLPVVHIHPEPNPNGRTVADVVLHEPTARRIVNSVGRFLSGQQEEVLECGPLCMNVPRRIFMAHGTETQLTPKQARLLALFMRYPGQTLDRKTIMSEVWETDYLGDTRTLDVHIRWLRRILENGGVRPRMLKTVRGVGYRLEVPDMAGIPQSADGVTTKNDRPADGR